ncbi:MAG: HEPN domain-containing protein [Marinobacterium sp.]|nr:HEPN domain-containing protein [Marinobacterium sp.]
MPSRAYRQFRHNMMDVKRLIDAHAELSPNHKGKRALGHITRSGVVMLCAAWELYAENVLIESAKYLAESYYKPLDLPKQAQKHLSKRVKEAKNELKPLELGGIGWKQLYVAYCQEEAKAVNTPKTTVLFPLYERFIGLVDVSDSWPVDAEYVDSFVRVRGDIAHNGRSAKYITISELRDYYGSIQSLVFDQDNYLCGYLFNMVDNTVQPWRRPRKKC